MSNKTAEESTTQSARSSTEKRVCPLSRKSRTVDEPRDEPDHVAETPKPRTINDPLDVIPVSTIPASGRGNSEDGSLWLNPSPNQLFRASARKEDSVALEDAIHVAHTHETVTVETWDRIMEYEALHADRCPKPTLESFHGMDGIYSMKARIFHTIFGVDYPFDRHDWTVDRCGKPVRYIIDYYYSEENGNPVYSFDARPAPTLPGGIWDRLRLAFRKYRDGEKWF